MTVAKKQYCIVLLLVREL